VSAAEHSAAASGERAGIFPAELLDACISCGFCLPSCPTYVRTWQETSSPRGRISLMRALEEGTLPADDPTIGEESSFCLGCRACESVCPAGVHYGELLEHWRDHLWHGRRRGVKLRGLLWLVGSKARVRMLGLVRRHAKGGGEAEGAQLMLGCFERGLYPQVSRAAQTLDPSLRAPADQGCCGALHAHNGELERGRAMARELGEQLPGTIVTTSGGCSAHLAEVLGRDRVRELSDWLTDSRGAAADPGAGEPVRAARGERGPGVNPPVGSGGAPGSAKKLRIGYQDSCHLRNGLGVHRQPRELLARIGEFVEIKGASECCGAAGTYSTLRPKDSKRVLSDKLDAIEAARVDVVAVVNPGCYRQLADGVKSRAELKDVRVAHLAELLVEAGWSRGG
jgi:glycolate oxidase iron-sulfur subunit